MFLTSGQQKKKTTYDQGLRAEYWAAWILRMKGYRILAHRFRTPLGEIDLIARRGGKVIFVEVKARKTLQEGLEALSLSQQRRLYQASKFVFLSFPQLVTCDIQFDLVVKIPWHLPHFLKNIRLAL